MSKYPEHDKLKSVREKSQAIGEFLHQMMNRGVILCEHVSGEERPVYLLGSERTPITREQYAALSARDQQAVTVEWEGREDGFHPLRKKIDEVLAEYFGIDLSKIDAEKEQMLETLRALNAPA